ncbi:hypothetical protein BX616_006156 [Lobosporangium transversale]|nr:hypothetical protein BX616_006156 [Lobosporangium transversale]
MFGSSSRTVLTPSKALQLFDVYMEYARRTGGSRDDDIVMELCLDADSALSRIQKSVKKALASPTSKEEAVLRQDIGSAYYELARIFERLGRAEDAQRHDKKAEKWGYVHGSVVIRQAPSINNTSNTNTNVNKKESNDTNAKTEKAPKPMGVRATTIHTSATIPKEIFDCDVPPTAVRYSLPGADDQLNDTHQLVYCLSLLPNAPFRSTDLTDNEQQWVQEMSNDREEQERLRNLISDVISQFASDEIKAEATVAEVVSLAPILSLDQFRSLLMALVNGISQNIMLETHLLEGLAELMQRAPPGYLDPDDLVTTLTTLSSRLQSTHDQSGSHLYHLSVTVSHVLDAMVNNQVKGLKREQLYEPLAAYLKGLKGSSDPHLVYQAAYASQALLYIPDDETTMQAMLRRTSAVLRGVFGVVSAVKGLDLNGFMDEISNIQEELPSITDIIDMSLGVYEGATSLYESGAAFRQSMEEGLSFSRKTAWYPALRTADALLQTGELTRFKVLVCEASCRRDPAFQWGLCERLGQIAAGKQWTVDTRKDAIEFLGEIYMNDQDWGCHVHIKQWIINILLIWKRAAYDD